MPSDVINQTGMYELTDSNNDLIVDTTYRATLTSLETGYVIGYTDFIYQLDIVEVVNAFDDSTIYFNTQDKNGNPLSGVTITIVMKVLGQNYSFVVTSDAAGLASFFFTDKIQAGANVEVTFSHADHALYPTLTQYYNVVNQTAIVAMGTHVQTMKITLVNVNGTPIVGAENSLSSDQGLLDY